MEEGNEYLRFPDPVDDVGVAELLRFLGRRRDKREREESCKFPLFSLYTIFDPKDPFDSLFARGAAWPVVRPKSTS